MPTTYLTESDHVIRHVSRSKIMWDNENKPIGIFPDAFKIRGEEKYLSVTWCQYYRGTCLETMCCAIKAVRCSGRQIKKQCCFVFSTVNNIATIAKKYGVSLRFTHEYEEANPAHAGIRNWDKVDQKAMATIVTSLKDNIIVNNRTMDCLRDGACPCSGCPKA